MKHLVIIGNGISGITCARYVRKKSDIRITVISSESEFFFSRTALMYVYMGHMTFEHIKPYEDWFWTKNKIDLIHEHVEEIDFLNKQVKFKNSSISYDKLVIATGSVSNKFGWPGQDFNGVQGLYSLQDLELMHRNTLNAKKAVVVGGGLIGIEMAEMLRSRNIEVTLLIREANFWGSVLPEEEGQLINRHIAEHKISLKLSTELKEIKGNESGNVKGIITQSGDYIEADFVGLTVGVSPNIDFLKNTELATDRGILVNNHFETNLPDVYAIGDCAQFKTPLPDRKPIEQVWYTGKIHGATLAKTLCGERSDYRPGQWFNSAKFIDIEYQNYGIVPATLNTETHNWFYWQCKNELKLIRIVFNKKDKVVQGFNCLGIRFRQDICAQWLNEKKTIDYVIEYLPEANFDPEFYKQYEPEIIKKYNQQFGQQLKIRSKKGLFSSI